MEMKYALHFHHFYKMSAYAYFHDQLRLYAYVNFKLISKIRSYKFRPPEELDKKSLLLN